MKELIIHAGTHKTATSYIQSRLWANRERLQAQGVVYSYPRSRVAKHKPLARALRRQQWGLWQSVLRQSASAGDRLLLSAEQFTKPLCRDDRLQPLLQLLDRSGYRLRVVVFLRDQPDYMNARYVHSVKRLYHHMSFEAYVRKQLHKGQNIFDYEYMLADLLGCSDVLVDLVDFRTDAGDPYERLMELLEIPSTNGWLPADSARSNVQPGCRGVWLARKLCRQLAEEGVAAARLRHSQRLVRRIAEANGWSSDRFFGFTPELAEAVAGHFAAANDRLARRIWGCTWRERYPWKRPDRRVYELPADGPDREMMLAHLASARLQLGSP